MSAAPHAPIRGWCPSLHAPMPSGDGLLARIRPPAATLTADQARALDDACAELGNGVIELTARGNLQCRGFTSASHARFVDIACALGLSPRDPLRATRLKLLAAPLIGQDPRLCAFEDALARDDTLDALPEKFLFRIEGGAIDTRAVAADIAIEGAKLRAGGLVATCADPGDAARALARAAAARIRDLPQEAVHACFARAGLAPVRAPAPPPPPETIGVLGGARAIGVAPPFAQLGPGDLTALASLARAHGDGTLRTTPFRTLILPGIPRAARAPTLRAAAGRGMVTDPADPRLRIRACIGAPFCLSAEAQARSVAADYLDRVPAAGILHLSGCAKRCAHPGQAAVTLVGRGGTLQEVALEEEPG